MPTLKYIVIGRDDVIAHIVETERFGMVVLFLNTKIDITQGIAVYNYPDTDKVDDIDLLNLVLFPFPNLKNEE